MAKSKETFNKREKEKQRQKEKREKREKMEERKANQSKGKSLDDMLAYIDENGNITSTPPDPRKRKEINAEDIEIGVPKLEEEAPGAFHEGRVEYFNQLKGFGFIIDKRGEKVFFHINQLKEPVKENDKVVFEVERGPKGWNAIGVKKNQ
jgi:cold shock CspA family protein